MQKIKIILVGKTKEKYCQLAEQEFLKRLQRYTNVEICIVREEKMTRQKPDAQIRAIEFERIQAQIEGNDYLILLDKSGKQFSSEALAKELQSLALKGISKLCFVIGGPLGFPEAFLKQANQVLSFSKMTFTHEMIRMLLLEQLYRAFTILNNEKYHK